MVFIFVFPDIYRNDNLSDCSTLAHWETYRCNVRYDVGTGGNYCPTTTSEVGYIYSVS